MTKAFVMVAAFLAFPGLLFGQVKPVAPAANPVPSPANSSSSPAKQVASPAKPISSPAKPDLLADAKQIAADMSKAAELQRNKKYEQARSIYQGIIAAHPKAEAVAAARWEIARSYMTENKFSLAEPLLEMVSADQAGSSPALREMARKTLAGARLSIAAAFVKDKKFNEAVATLQKTVNDNQFSAAAVRASLLAIASIHLNANQTAAAIADYRLLITKPTVGDKDRLDDIVALTLLDPTGVKDLEAYIKGHPATQPILLAQARYESSAAYLRLKQPTQAVAALDSILAMTNVPFEWTRNALLRKAQIAIAAKDRKAAEADYRLLVRSQAKPPFYSLDDRFNDLEALVRLAPGADVTEEVAMYLNLLPSPASLRVSSAAPNDDVLYAIAAPKVADAIARYAEYLRETTGRSTPEQLAPVITQLTTGGALRPFAVSEFSKTLAKRISGSAPLGEFLKPLLSGEYQAAAQIAWRRARLAHDNETRNEWLRAVAVAVRCQDQTRAGRASLFLQWVTAKSAAIPAPIPAAAASQLPTPATAAVTNSEKGVAPNPLADYLDLESLPFQPATGDVARAVTYLNGLTTVSALNQANEITRVVPENDVITVATRGPAEALQWYQFYLWRTTGRALPEQLKTVELQSTLGGALRPFVVSDFSKDLAKRISGDAPLAEYLKPLLNGEYQAAARVAWRRARLARDETVRDDWTRAVAFAVRGQDQCWAGQASAFLKWADVDPASPAAAPVGKRAIRAAAKAAAAKAAAKAAAAAVDKGFAPNPLADYLDLVSLPFQPAAAEVTQAVAHLNQLSTIAKLNQVHEISQVVPGNDVITLATRGPADAALYYRFYLWQTTGRDDAKRLATAEAQFMHGGTARPLAVSEQSKMLAGMVSDKAPLADYLKPLLNGDYQGAARVAWKKARAAKTNAEYVIFIGQIALAIRCRDQAVGGRDADFIRWTQGTLKGPEGQSVNVNPEATFLGE